jgi:hypothetical protein
LGDVGIGGNNFGNYNRIIMKREKGYYWVRIGCLDWEVCQYLGDGIWRYNLKIVTDIFFSEINEKRIKSPEEK